MTKPNPEDQARRTLDLLRTLAFVRLGQLNGYSSQYIYGEGPADGAEAFVICGTPNARAEMRRSVYAPVLRQLMAQATLYTEDWQNDDLKRYGVANTWLTYAVKFRPPGAGIPEYPDIRRFRDVLRQEWVAVGKPRLIVPVGLTAIRAISGKGLTTEFLSEHLGQIQHTLDREGDSIYICPMAPPEVGQRQPQFRDSLEQHWTQLGTWRLKHAEAQGHPRR